MNLLHKLLKIAIILSFFLPFVESCGIRTKNSLTASSDTASVYPDTTMFLDTTMLLDSSQIVDTFTIEDTQTLTQDSLEVGDRKNQESTNYPVLKSLFNQLIMPDYTEEISVTGFGLFYFSILAIIQNKVNEIKIAGILISLSFIFSLISFVISSKRMFALRILNLFIITCFLIFIVLSFKNIDEILWGFWITLCLVLINQIIIELKRKKRYC